MFLQVFSPYLHILPYIVYSDSVCI
ncbi:unnamed protein product [Ectocarpus sp. CCAP 1310/34]|nr:unnamed protein product [Ectocarpus sp. CCAP 1310/34]